MDKTIENRMVDLYSRTCAEIKTLSKKTGIKRQELLQIIRNRELVLMNSQLYKLNEHLTQMENSQNPVSHQKEVE